ncbi:MAG TPA: hypothetical protein VF920_13295 [Dongiaceae bacterium]
MICLLETVKDFHGFVMVPVVFHDEKLDTIGEREISEIYYARIGER